MFESGPLPDTLEACQQELREVRQAYAQLERKYQELLDTCASIQDAQQKLREENEEQQLTIQQLLHQLHGRRSERHKDARGQQHLDFSVDETAALAVDGVGLTPDVGKGSRQARFWIYRGIQEAPYNVFAFTDSRAREGPDRFLESFRGILRGDCYSGYINIEQVTGGRIEFSACVAHARRKVFLSREQCPALSSPLLALLGERYDLEDRGRLLSDAQRLVLRQQESVPVMARLRAVLDRELARGVLPKSKFGQALSYLRNHWPAFQVFLRDGRVAIDNNDAERELRRGAIGRKNWMFIGSQDAGERTAAILSVISSAHRHDLDEWAYLYDVLDQLSRGTADLNSLLPDVWKAAHPAQVRTFRVDEKQPRAERRRYLRARRRLQQREAASPA